MFVTYRCRCCGKRFHYHGKCAQAISDLIDVKCKLEMCGFSHIHSGWKIVQDRAKCCSHPDITPDRMDVPL